VSKPLVVSHPAAPLSPKLSNYSVFEARVVASVPLITISGQIRLKKTIAGPQLALGKIAGPEYTEC
jgi:hypothetical protein